MKNAHHTQVPNVTFSFVQPAIKNASFTLINDKEKQQVLTFLRNWIQQMFEIFVCKMTSLKVVGNLFSFH